MDDISKGVYQVEKWTADVEKTEMDCFCYCSPKNIVKFVIKYYPLKFYSSLEYQCAIIFDRVFALETRWVITGVQIECAFYFLLK